MSSRKNANKCVCCQRYITSDYFVCSKCAEEHNIIGKPYKEWPEWLKFLINDTRKESYIFNLDYDREISFSDVGWDTEGEGIDLDTFNSMPSISDYAYNKDDDLSNRFSSGSFDDSWSEVDGTFDSELDLNKLLQILTPRETEVLHMLMDGYNDEEISIRLDLSQQRIGFCHNEIKRKATKLGISRL